jgi:tRNA-splicing ligase RtcB
MSLSSRLIRALAREGIAVSDDGPVVTLHITADPDAPAADILLPPGFALEGKAVHQLVALAGVRHPDGGRPSHVCATPDFHPGDAGIAIGSVFASSSILVPQAVGTDVNCGMRLHTTGLTVDRFLEHKQEVVDALTGDFLLGTRDVVVPAAAMRAAFADGLAGFAPAMRGHAPGRLVAADFGQVEREAWSGVWEAGSLCGDLSWAPDPLVPPDGVVRDEGLATIGRGNHFVEVQVVDEIADRPAAYAAGLRVGDVVVLVHSGSRTVGLAIGGRWKEKAREAWPANTPYPESGIFPISWEASPDLCREYLRAEATAANYAFVNRALLAELVRLRLRESVGDVEMPLVADVPHNLTFREDGGYVARKGACPAHAGQPVLIPGSMGAASYYCLGLGSDRFLASASHGAGRATSRGAMGRSVRDKDHEAALGLAGVECITLREERRVKEAPSAYKPIAPIIETQVQAGTIREVARFRPLLTFKA